MPLDAPFEPSRLPQRVTRDRAAELVTQRYFEVSPRTLERWPLAWRRLNGKAHCETQELFALAEQMLASAPPPTRSSRANRLAAALDLRRQSATAV